MASTKTNKKAGSKEAAADTAEKAVTGKAENSGNGEIIDGNSYSPKDIISDSKIDVNGKIKGVIGDDATHFSEAAAETAQEEIGGESADAEPTIIDGRGPEVIFTPEAEGIEPEAESFQSNDSIETEGNEEKVENPEKSLRIIDGGGSEIIIDEIKPPEPDDSEAEKCMRNKGRDKKIADYGTYAAAALFIIAIIMSAFNIKGMRYPVSFLILGLAGLTMGITTALRLVNNNKCGCKICKTQNKNFMYSIMLWAAVFIGGLIAFLVLTFA